MIGWTTSLWYLGWGGMGGGASLHHTNLSRLTGTRFVSLKLVSFANRFRDFRIGWTTVLWCWSLGGRGGIASCKTVGVDMDPFCKFGDCSHLQTVLEILG